METFYEKVILHRKKIMAVFIVLFVLMAVCKGMVAVNYDMNSYLPEDSASTVALDVMEEEFDGGIPNARVMIRDVSVAEALEYKEALEQIEGVSDVTWLDDSISVEAPLEVQDEDVIETYYKDGCALFSVTIEEEDIISAVADIRELIGEENAMTGSAVSTAIATNSTVSEISKIAVIAVIFVFFVLTLTTSSWFEPVIVLAGLGVAIVINAGSNLIFGEISFVTNAAGNILQLAVSLDYSVFLIHRFEECRMEEENPEIAMKTALCKSTSSILSSGLTTVIGFLALVMMRFRIGPDLGLALAKGVAISLITVFVFMPGLILSTYKLLDRTVHRPLVPSFRKFGALISKIMVPVAILFILVIAPAYMGSISNSYYYGSSHIFSEGTPLGDDTAAIEEIFGESDTYVLLVPRGDTATEKELSEELKKLDKVTNIISYVDMAGTQIPYEYLDEDTLSLLESEHYSRMVISVEVPYEGEETTTLIDEIRNIAEEKYPGAYYLAGEGVSTYDLQETVTADMVKVNLLAIAAVFLVLLLTMRSISLPVILVLTIETAIWLNLSCSYYVGSPLFYIAYLIISSIQLGATVDYAILFTDRYKENREKLGKKESVIETISNVTVSVLTSGLTLTVVGFLLGIISTHGLLSQLGYLIGRGTLCSLGAVLFVLPGLLYLFDGLMFRKERKKMKNAKKVTAALLVGVVVLSNSGVTTYAAAKPSEKEEVIYAMLDANGKVTGVYAVNIFSGGEIVDYGDYTNVRNMTTTDEITVEGDLVTLSSDADKVYYQGDLEEAEIPWNISIQYFLDGKKYEPKELAGKSGALEIRISITQNAACREESFWDGYALQTTVVLDTKNCSNIETEGATVANVASDKQLSYIILPGKEKDISITADVTDFEMEEISINGVKMDLALELDESEIQDKVGEIQDAVGELNDGASELNDGASALDDGVSDLNEGIAEINEALKTLNGKSSSLTGGSTEVLKALQTIQTSLSNISMNAESLSVLAQSSAQIKSGIESLTAGLDALDGSIAQYYSSLQEAGVSDAKTYAATNEQAAAALGITDLQRSLYAAYCAGGENGVMTKLAELVQGGDEAATTLYTQYVSAGYDASVITSYVENAGKLISIEQLLLADASYIRGSDTLISGIDAALDKENGELMTGALTLQSKYGEFDSAIQSMTISLGSLAQNMTTLKSGIDTLVANYQTLDSGVGEYTDAVAKIAAGYGQVYNGSLELAEGTSDLYSGTKELLNGTEEFKEETSDMDTQISDTISDTIDTMTGKNVKIVSFVSEKNINVDSVQFVMKTEAIEKEEAEQEEEKTEEATGFWQKFLNSFGIGEEK